jgi:hypothetical protein
MIYDIIIIGAGISGLYSAYKLKKKYPNTNILILEKSNYIGGRMGNEDFYGSKVTIAAGIGRKNKDKYLVKLLSDFNVKYREYQISHDSKINNCDTNTIKDFIKDLLKENIKKGYTFEEFIKAKLGKEYKTFIECSGYTDYLKGDAYDTLHYYGFDDLYNHWIGMGINWNDLLEKLIDFINKKNIKLNTCVEHIKYEHIKYEHIKYEHIKYEHIKYNDHIIIKSNNGYYKCKKVIIASTIDTVKKLLPSNKIYNYIKGQPFMRVYGKFSKNSIEILKKYINKTTIVKKPIQKIIPINPDNGVYMIVYNDNKNALKLKKYTTNTKTNRIIMTKLIKKLLNISEKIKLISMKQYFWNIGTHYYKPYVNINKLIKEGQRPCKNIFVVGEMISTQQGWVNGALESVEKILHYI